MSEDALKLELITWLSTLKDPSTLDFLKIIKEARSSKSDWWDDLSSEQKASIQRGLDDINNGRTTPHSEVKKNYGL